MEDGVDQATIHLSGREVRVLEEIQREMELHEKSYSIPEQKVNYLAGPKFANISTFKEKSGLMLLLLKREGNGQQLLKAVGN